MSPKQHPHLHHAHTPHTHTHTLLTDQWHQSIPLKTPLFLGIRKHLQWNIGRRDTVWQEHGSSCEWLSKTNPRRRITLFLPILSPEASEHSRSMPVHLYSCHQCCLQRDFEWSCECTSNTCMHACAPNHHMFHTRATLYMHACMHTHTYTHTHNTHTTHTHTQHTHTHIHTHNTHTTHTHNTHTMCCTWAHTCSTMFCPSEWLLVWNGVEHHLPPPNHGQRHHTDHISEEIAHQGRNGQVHVFVAQHAMHLNATSLFSLKQ